MTMCVKYIDIYVYEYIDVFVCVGTLFTLVSNIFSGFGLRCD